jgi:hypothetical protein
MARLLQAQYHRFRLMRLRVTDSFDQPSRKYANEPLSLDWSFRSPLSEYLEQHLDLVKAGRDAILDRDGCAFKKIVHRNDAPAYPFAFIMIVRDELKALSGKTNDPSIPHGDLGTAETNLLDSKLLAPDGALIYQVIGNHKGIKSEKPDCEVASGPDIFFGKIPA